MSVYYFRFELYIDEEVVDSSVYPVAARFPLARPSGGGLYIGGLPSGVDGRGKAASLRSLLGCVSDVVLNGK